MSYFNLDLNPKLATSLRHALNQPYRGSRPFELSAPDAQGVLVVHARSAEEADEHVVNALFDLIFNRSRVGAAIDNPACIFCQHRTESRGRNSSGTRGWRCLSVECGRSFVLGRAFRGGINHPSQSNKPEFFRLVFKEGRTIIEAADIVGISHGAADNWYLKMAILNGESPFKCPCGKPLRHRGSCKFRQTYKKVRAHELTRSDLGEHVRISRATEASAG